MIALIESVAASAGIRRRHDQRRGDPRADDLRARQRGRARARGGRRVAGLRHRRHLPDRLRLSRLSRRPDVLRGHASALRTIHDRIAAFHRELGPRWKPAPLLARLAREGSTFREFDAAPKAIATPASRSLMAIPHATRKANAIGQHGVRRTWRSATAPDGVVYLQSRHRLGRVSRCRLTERLEYWADRAPRSRVSRAARSPPAQWRSLTYAETLRVVRRVVAGAARPAPVAANGRS